MNAAVTAQPKSPRRIQADGGALAGVRRRLRRSQRQQGGGVACGGLCGFAGISGGWRSVRLRQPRLTFRNLLFAVFVEGIHDIVQALVYDLAVAPHHRHRFPPAQIHQIHISRAL